MHPYAQATFTGTSIWLPTLPEFKAAVRSKMTAVGQQVARLHTLNPEILMKAEADQDYASVLRSTEWSVVDGVGLSLVLRAHGVTVPARICGSDLIYDLASACLEANRPLFILGGEPARRVAAENNLRKAYPGLEVLGFSPSYGAKNPAEEEHVAQMMTAHRPAVVAVCLGAPRQEQWMYDNQDMLTAAGVHIAAGLGGTVDFLSGMVPRAPVVLRKLGLEWAYRLVREPARWKRQLALPVFALRGLIPGRVTKLQPDVAPVTTYETVEQ
jgi:N-acetylglucosaminyldiphosphoundecaprenol N-acetyl-beta-D-mannosaminyltransferase